MALFLPESGLLFWMVLSFGFVFFILAKFGFPVINKAVDKRNNYINDSLDAARRAERRISELDKEAESILEDARVERNSILNKAQQTGSMIVGEAKQNAESEARDRMSRAQSDIEEQKRRAMGEVRDQIADISVRIAEKVLSEKLGDNREQRELIERLLSEDVSNKNQ